MNREIEYDQKEMVDGFRIDARLKEEIKNIRNRKQPRYGYGLFYDSLYREK